MKQQQSSIQLEESHCNEHLLLLTVSIIQPFLVNIFLVKLPSFLLSSVRLGANKPRLALGMCPDWNRRSAASIFLTTMISSGLGIRSKLQRSVKCGFLEREASSLS